MQHPPPTTARSYLRSSAAAAAIFLWERERKSESEWELTTLFVSLRRPFFSLSRRFSFAEDEVLIDDELSEPPWRVAALIFRLRFLMQKRVIFDGVLEINKED